MPAPRISEKELLNTTEMELFTLSHNATALSKQSHAQLRSDIARARNLRDRARDLYRRQVGRTKAATNTKRGYSGMANERTRQKSEILSGVVERLSTAHAAAA